MIGFGYPYLRAMLIHTKPSVPYTKYRRSQVVLNEDVAYIIIDLRFDYRIENHAHKQILDKQYEKNDPFTVIKNDIPYQQFLFQFLWVFNKILQFNPNPGG
jgi:hypothetical protein